MREFIEQIEKLWCEVMHTKTMWPIHGAYRCGTCLREYPVAFATAPETGVAGQPALPEFCAPVSRHQTVSLY